MALKVIYLSNAEMDSYGFKGLDNVVDRFMLMRKELFNWISEQNEMPTKHKMTKAEAIACFEKHMPDVHKADRTIDFYIEAGMLEIVEEKPLIFNDILRQFGITDTKRFQELIEANGYKIQKQA